MLKFIPGIGYQFHKNWTVGVVANISSTRYSDHTNPSIKGDAWTVGPFLRYTYPLSSVLSLYGQLDGGYVSSKSSGNQLTPTKIKGGTVEVYPAVFINIKNNFGLNFNFGGISYVTSKQKGVDGMDREFSLGFGKTANIGILKNF